MIGILLNDASYEQDIRELLMAFYPGEGFAHERTGGVDFMWKERMSRVRHIFPGYPGK